MSTMFWEKNQTKAGRRRSLSTALAMLLGVWAAVFVEPRPLMAANFALGPYFTDNMVLQKPERALGATTVWARTDLDERITVEFQGKEPVKGTVKNGIWRAQLTELDAKLGPSDLVIRNRAKQELVRLTNVVVGEVWVLGISPPAVIEFHPVRGERFAETIQAGSGQRFRVVAYQPGTTAAADSAGPAEWHMAQPEDCHSMERTFSNDAAYLAQGILTKSVGYVGIIEVPKTALATRVPVGNALPPLESTIDQGFVVSRLVWDAVRDANDARTRHLDAVANLKRIGLVTNAPAPSLEIGPQQYSRGKLTGLDFPIRGCMW